MFKTEKTQENVLAFKLSNVITKQDVEAMRQAFDKKLAKNDYIGIVVDATEFDDMTVDAIVADMKFELGLLGKLDRFPRMAIISEKQYIAAILKFAGPYIPMIEVKQFTASDYNKALTFAAKVPEVSVNKKSSVSSIETGNPKILAFDIVGRVDLQNIQAVVQPLQSAFESKGKVDVLLKVDNYTGFDPAILKDRSLLSLKLTAMEHLRRYAVVGAKGWMENLVKLLKPFVSFDVRTFNQGEEAKALAWLRS